MKDILVHLDGGDGCGVRLLAAIDLATRFGAKLTGLFAQTDVDGPSITARRPSSHLLSAAERTAEAFQQAVAAAGLTGQWLQLPHGEPGFVVAETAFCARYADLVVLGQTPAEGAKVPGELVEQTILQSGRPALVIPEGGPGPTLGARVAVAWNASREASRVLHDALPLLQRAEQVTLLSIRQKEAATNMGDLPRLDILGHLANQGVTAKSERVVEEDVGVMDGLALRTYELGADLLVMGAHSGLGVMRGAGTRYMLRTMTIPVFMSC